MEEVRIFHNIDNFINSNKFGQQLKITPQHFIIIFFIDKAPKENASKENAPKLKKFIFYIKLWVFYIP